MNANQFLVGTDPEFCVLSGQHGMNVAQHFGPRGKLGWDHGGRVVEIRPSPRYATSLICADIFQQLNRRELVPLRQFRWKAGGMAGDQPIGGHIHLDVPYPYESEHYPQLNALDRMAEWFERVELFPRGETEARIHNGYGSRTSLDRVRGSGSRPDGHPHLEYRVPPSWLYSPKLAHLTLTSFKLALVEPDYTLDQLSSPDIRPVTKFREFIRGFAATDDDAAELAPQLSEGNSLNAFRGDPADDIKDAWGIPQVPLASFPATVESF
jgi:hypothetical protein